MRTAVPTNQTSARRPGMANALRVLRAASRSVSRSATGRSPAYDQRPPSRLRRAMDGPQRIADAFATTRGRAALMPYLMGGFPSLEQSRRIGEAYADGGADLVELGVPFSDPLADGPVVQAAGTAALRAGSTVGGVLDVCSTLAE